MAEHSEHIPPELLAHLCAAPRRAGASSAHRARPPQRLAARPGAVICPVRIVWGTADRLLPGRGRGALPRMSRRRTGSSSTGSATAAARRAAGGRAADPRV